MATLQDLKTRAGAALRPNRELAFVAVASIALLVLPDIVFHYAGYQSTSVLKRESMLLAALLAIGVTLIERRGVRLVALGAVLICQVLWLGCLAYFGRPLGPDQLLLAGHEAADVTAGILDGWRVLLPPVLTIALTGLVLTHLQKRTLPVGSLRGIVGGYLLVLTLIGCATYWMTHKRVIAAIPGSQTFSALGPYQTAVAATRLLMSPVVASPSMKLTSQSVAPQPIQEEPATIVVVMGEGISPTRLSLFGFGKDTSPILSSWRTSPPKGFELIAKIGFSGGVATFGSVPAFIKMAYWPVEAEWRGVNLFDLAHAAGFKSWYLSAQSRHFLDIAGGATGAEKVVAEQGHVAQLAARHDDFLVDLAQEIPSDPKRRFVFFHQRVNHSNYTSHCSHLSSVEQRKLYIFDQSGQSTEDRRRAAYDNGLRCWDRNIAELAQPFLGSPGAVHILVLSDHNEMMGEGGMWGHSHGDLRVSQIPVLLLTNRPDSDFAKRFRAMTPPTWYQLSRLVALGLGHDVSTPGTSDTRFYLNTTMPFGRSGYFEVEVKAPDQFHVKRYSREGQLQTQSDVTFEEMGLANAAVADTRTQRQKTGAP